MPRYTIIVEYAGGTYVSQTQASNRFLATRWWLDHSDSAPYIHKNKSKRMRRLESRLTDLDCGVGPLTGCLNVWQCLFKLGGRFGSFHIIATCEDIE